MFDERAELLIEKFFENSLTQPERAELDARAAGDPALKRRLEEDAFVRAALQSAPDYQFGPAFSERIARDIEDEERLARLLSAHGAQGFKPSIAPRVIRTIAKDQVREPDILNFEVGETLGKLFPKIAAPVAAAAGLAIFSNVSAAAAGTPVIDSMLGLPGENEAAISLMIIR